MTLLTSMMEQSAVRCFGWTLLQFVWQAALIAGLIAIVQPILRRVTSHTRYLVLCGAMMSMALAPVVTWCWMMTVMPVTPISIATPLTGTVSNTVSGANHSIIGNVESSSVISNNVGGSNSLITIPDKSAVASSVPSPVDSPVWSTRLRQLVEPALTWFVGIWLVGVLVLSIRLLTGWRLIQRLRRQAITPVTDIWQRRLQQLAERLQITRTITLVESALVDVPTVIGWLRPMILLPTSFLTGLSPDQVESILVHELAHIRRHDFVINLIQTTIEVLLFYHPAVWWLSNRIREEREHCCDDTAVAICGNTYVYARALATMEELRRQSTQRSPSGFALAAGGGGSLLQRIRRLAVGTPDVRQSNWWGASVFVMATVTGLGLAVYAVSHAKDEPPVTPKPASVTNGKTPAETVVAQADRANAPTRAPAEWGAKANGIRFRIVPVPANSDDEAPDLSKTVSTFARSDDMTFAVELKNASDRPITLMGLRYGDSYASAVGKLNMSFFAPHLFDLEFTDDKGKPIARPSRVFERDMLALSGVSTHTLAPGTSLIEVLRPGQFMFPMNYDVAPGQYRLKMNYQGPSEAVVAEIKKHWPDKPQTLAWTNRVTSNEVAFTVAPNAEDGQAKLVWGAAKDGLQAAIELRRPRLTNGAPGSVGSPNEAPGVPTKSAISVIFHVKNVSDRNITFSSETGRQGDTIQVKDEAGKAVSVSVPWYSGWPTMVRWVLKPGEVADLNALVSGLDTIENPGKYTVQYTIRFNSMQSKDDAGNITFPLKEDWQSELATGVTPFFLRTRTPEDDAREKPPTFVGRIEFTGPDGKPVDSGVLTWKSEIPNKEFTNRSFGRGPIEIPESTFAPASATVRAAGFEEAVFQDVKLKPNETKRFELVPATSARLTLVWAGKPVAGAKIRFFNKTSGLASSGPIPMDGFEGPVWATTGADGVAVIDSMQKVDPYYKKLGDAIYFFCIEAPVGADGKPISPPQVIGPVKAGQDLGIVALGPPLEVRGEIRGTPEELKRFAAEWDQPFAMKTDNPEATWDYAVSKRLDTKVEGDKLTFHLTGLTPGRLRIVANFGPEPHKVSHTYTRRDPKEGDTVVDIELKKSLSNLIVTPKGVPDGVPGAAFMDARDKGMKIVFVIDASGSMASHNAMQVAKDALMTSLLGLDERQQFMIIFYDDKPHVIKLRDEAKPTMTAANDLNKTLARQKITAVQLGSGTNHVTPLEMALGLKPDVIFFLTDALDPPLWPKELDRLKSLNGGQARIHSIEFGQGPELIVEGGAGNFLHKLANQNGGTYRYHDVTQFKGP